MPRGNDEEPKKGPIPPPVAKDSEANPIIAARDPHVHRLIQRYKRRLTVRLNKVNANNELDSNRLTKIYNTVATQAAGNGKELTPKDQRMLVMAGRKDPETGEVMDKEARELLVMNHQRTVSSLMKRHLGRGVGEDELLQSGLMGVTHAIDKYDVNSAATFRTYAEWWINKEMGKALLKYNDVGETYKTQEVRNLRSKAAAISNKLASRNFGQIPTEEQLIDELIAQSGDKDNDATRAKYQEVVRAMDEQICSLDASFLGDDHLSFAELMGDPDSDTPLQAEESSEAMREILSPYIGNLDLTEREIINRHFGMNGYEETSITKIARELGRQRSTVQTLYSKALDKMKNSMSESGFSAVGDIKEE